MNTINSKTSHLKVLKDGNTTFTKYNFGNVFLQVKTTKMPDFKIEINKELAKKCEMKMTNHKLSLVVKVNK